jgi:dipeptidyl aminopeptidase/acylaminoacyl peptidase
MTGDGKDKSKSPYQIDPWGDITYSADLGHLVHGETRWILEMRQSPSDPDGGALFAVSEWADADGQPLSVVLLIDGIFEEGFFVALPLWAKDDSFISILIDTWSDDFSTFSTELYRIEVTFDASGTPAITSEAEWELVAREEDGIGNYDWSPDGSRVVYMAYIESGGFDADIKVQDLNDEPGQATTIYTNGYAPLWSPADALIAFYPWDTAPGVHVIATDGSGLRQLTKSVYDGGFQWSPDGSALAVHRVSWRNTKWGSLYSADIIRVPVSGGPEVNLTKDIDGYASLRWWR